MKKVINFIKKANGNDLPKMKVLANELILDLEDFGFDCEEQKQSIATENLSQLKNDCLNAIQTLKDELFDFDYKLLGTLITKSLGI